MRVNKVEVMRDSRIFVETKIFVTLHVRRGMFENFTKKPLRILTTVA
jgi:hypothetical protein